MNGKVPVDATLTEREREPLRDAAKCIPWARWDDAALAPMFSAVEGILAQRAAPDPDARLRGVRFCVEVACDGYANLTDKDVPDDFTGFEEDYIQGAHDAAEAIRAVLDGGDVA